MNVLNVEGLFKSYRKGFKRSPLILNDVSFSIEAGKVTGFLGSNGAGKTTTLKCILDLAVPDKGKIIFFEKGPLTVETKSHLGFLPERPYFYEYLTGQEFLRFYGELSTKLKTVDLKSRINLLLKKVNLAHAGNRQLRTYSKGMLQRIGVAQALIHEPKFIILDEPMAGLDPDGRMEIAKIIEETAKAGSAVFFSSHLIHDAEALCHNLVIVKSGKVAYHGSTKALLEGLHSGYKVTYSDVKSMGYGTISVQSLSDLQKSIDELRKTRSEILEVRTNRSSLEDAFAKIGAGGGTGE
jgi:ABC-2 type transport system ATP-binding protein